MEKNGILCDLTCVFASAGTAYQRLPTSRYVQIQIASSADLQCDQLDPRCSHVRAQRANLDDIRRGRPASVAEAFEFDQVRLSVNVSSGKWFLWRRTMLSAYLPNSCRFRYVLELSRISVFCPGLLDVAIVRLQYLQQRGRATLLVAVHILRAVTSGVILQTIHLQLPGFPGALAALAGQGARGSDQSLLRVSALVRLSLRAALYRDICL